MKLFSAGIFIMRNASLSVLHNAIIDVRLRRHEMIFFCISETSRVCNIKIYHDMALDSLYIWTGNDVITYFWSAASRTNVFILGHVRVASSP